MTETERPPRRAKNENYAIAFRQEAVRLVESGLSQREVIQRLGINHERLLVYLDGFHKQLDAAGGDIGALLARGEQREAQLRLERLRAGCVTLGLGGAAATLQALAPAAGAAAAGAAGVAAPLASAAVQAALAGVVRAVLQQSAEVRQAGAA